MDHLEWFPAPEHCTRVTFRSDELSSVCPVTRQPDLSSILIEYEPDQRCIESKSLKLYLWSFRDRPAFAEALAAEIAAEVKRAAQPRSVKVVLTQHIRGGIVTEATAELP
jgi:7-cyano-7-deazaguanine reductase